MRTDGNDYLKIEFDGEIYYLDADKLEDGGCIELEPRMNELGFSWAYLNPAPDGRIMQFLQELGTVKDIKIIKEEEE